MHQDVQAMPLNVLHAPLRRLPTAGWSLGLATVSTHSSAQQGVQAAQAGALQPATHRASRLHVGPDGMCIPPVDQARAAPEVCVPARGADGIRRGSLCARDCPVWCVDSARASSPGTAVEQDSRIGLEPMFTTAPSLR